ncbi:hypothetical protein K435DRAFT_970413 [Dendrothele bispora CBS 962.96]|uniref:DUF6534 domain-containing protein n=1 Tax=Dendrothele bispora (strain CBS 962.96) TaxID=1314807 RepID=A0A4S8LC55_DENBC|nr:hypothetical protein K435DRAFT_970413 [Dendrothele bispora CBS 962.96]
MSSPAEASAGPIFIGWMFNLFFLGIITVQGYIYMTTYKKDRLWIKIFVAVLMVINFLNTIFTAVYLYDTLVVKFGDTTSVTTANWLTAMDPVTTGVTAIYVQLFFIWRIKVLTGSMMLAGAILLPATAGLIGSIASSLSLTVSVKLANLILFKAWVIVWLIGAAVADLMITFVLVAWLVGFSFNAIFLGDVWLIDIQRKHKRGFRASNELVDRIIRSTIQTGALTTVVAFIDLLLYLALPTNNLHLIFNFPLCKLYSITLMSSLNSRQGWAFGSTESEGHTRSASNTSRFDLTGVRSTQVVVHVEHEMERVGGQGDTERDRDTEVDSQILDQKGHSVFAESNKTLVVSAV